MLLLAQRIFAWTMGATRVILGPTSIYSQNHAYQHLEDETGAEL
jgi:hypothetical protein|tara:strand:+ start:430 stop:561 length:132 start_codon:yes stop_codon:yes gene_type:complete